MPKIDLATLPVKRGSGYPAKYLAHNGDNSIRHGQSVAVGLTAFGARRVVLPPGAASSLRHFHTQSDELVIVMSGELVMLTNAGETPMRAGDIAAFPKNDGDAHCFVNRSSAEAVIIAVGDNPPNDEYFYPDVHMRGAPGQPYTDTRTGEKL